jgi:acetyl esterase/lipase
MVDRVRLAELMTAAAGREVIAEDLPAGFTLPPGQPDGLGAMFAEYDRRGFHGGNPLVLRAILQHEPRTVAGYIAELGAAVSGHEDRAIDPPAAPGRLRDAAGLPPAYIEVGQLDVFRDEALRYAYDAIAFGADVSRRAQSDRDRVLRSL